MFLSLPVDPPKRRLGFRCCRRATAGLEPSESSFDVVDPVANGLANGKLGSRNVKRNDMDVFASLASLWVAWLTLSLRQAPTKTVLLITCE